MLDISNITKTFGTFTAVDDVSLTISPGEVIGVMGVNGAGKTTLLNCVSGLVKPTSGTVVVDGASLSELPPHRVITHGLGRTFQIPRCFKGLTCLENLLVAGEPSPDMEKRAIAALDRVRLGHLRYSYANELSGGQQKLLEFARLTMCEPRYVLLDEPFAGMHPDLCRQLTMEIEAMIGAGKGFLLVSHDPQTLYRLSSEIIVMNQGRIICRGEPEVVRNDPAVIEAYLGTGQQRRVA